MRAHALPVSTRRHADDPGELAPDAPIGEAVGWAVAHAVHAPSELNSQPWSFRASVDRLGTTAVVELLLDASRLLPRVDPDGREAVLACGAALENLLLVLHGAGLSTTVALTPGPPRTPLVLAEVTVSGRATEPAADRPLRLAIPFRGSHRGDFEPAQVPSALLDHLVAAAAAAGAPVTVVDDTARALLVALEDQGTALLRADPAYLAEVAAWIRTNTSEQRDGVPGYARGLTTWQSWVDSFRQRTGHHPPRGFTSTTALTDAAVLIVVGAPSDAPDALVRAGRAMQRLLLTARTAGLSASFCNAALQVPALRPAVGRAVQLDHPQVLLRLGYAPHDPPVPRRTVRDVLHVTS